MKPETYIDIHTHAYYKHPDTTLLLNTFPEEPEKFNLPVWLSVGLHPWHIRESTWPAQVDMVGKAAVNNKVLAIGETGLDKKISVDYELQKEVFAAQLAIAEKNQKPVIIHCVRSYSELLAIRKKSNQSLPWIFHWFNTDENIARELIRKNCYLSFGHMLFNEQSKAYGVFGGVPLDHIFFETDDTGYTIHDVYARGAELRNLEIAALKNQIFNNFVRCFHL
jgi:TatD DNase family protein